MTNLNIYKYIIFPDCGCWMGGLSGGVEVRNGEMGGDMVRGVGEWGKGGEGIELAEPGEFVHLEDQ